MNWFTAALIALPLISLAWLSLKKAQQRGIPHVYSLALYFLVIVVGIAGWHSYSRTPFPVPTPMIAALFVIAAIASATANLLVMHSFEHSANPGLSLALLATQSVWLVAAGIVLFKASVVPLALTGVILVIAGIWSIHLKSTKVSFNWVWLGLGAGVLSAAVWVLMKYVQQLAPEYHAATSMMYLIIPQLFIYPFIGACRKHKMHFSAANLGLLLVGGIIGTFANVMLLIAILNAPNPGYAQAVTSSNIILTLLLAPLLTKSTLTWRQVVATLLIIAGVVIIRLGGG